MATGAQVLTMLIPDGGWAISGNDFVGITFIEAKPISKADFEAGFAKFDAWKLEQEANLANSKAGLLQRLGITEEEAKLLLS